MNQPTLKVSEIFYSLQGEGARSGEPSIFVRLQGCSAKHACYAQGVVCDTEFESGEDMGLDELWGYMEKATGNSFPFQQDGIKCDWIVWTGGEPLDQLTPEILSYFRERGYKQAIETSGIKPMPQEMGNLLDYIVVSPKVAEHVLLKHFGHLELQLQYGKRSDADIVMVDELRYVRHSGQPGIPQPALKANYYYVSPHSDGAEINQENLKHCIKLCLENPQWRLSVQAHKLWRIL